MKITWMAVAVMFLTGCGGAAGLQRTLGDHTGELLYLHDSATAAEKQGGTVKIVSFVIDDILPPETTVKQKSGYFVPLLFFNFWKYQYECRLGYAQIENDYKQFVRESFIEELERSGRFRRVEDRGDLELEIEISSLSMSAPMLKAGSFIFIVYGVGYSESTSAGPVDSLVTAKAVVRKKGKELVNREFQGKSRTNVLSGKNVKLEDYTTTMIEGLSFALKDLNESIVKEINHTQ